MILVSYLKSKKVVSGPVARQTRHSELSNYKTWLQGKPLSFGYKAHNNFGNATHESFLEGKITKRKLTPEERVTMNGMMAVLWAHPVVKRLLIRTINEKRLKFVLNGVKMGGTPDVLQKWAATVSDLKTTMCSSIASFMKAAFKYGYYRQAVTYLKATGCKHYFIIGIQKGHPYNIYILEITKEKSKMRYAEKELEFLLYFFKHYGNITKLRKTK